MATNDIDKEASGRAGALSWETLPTAHPSVIAKATTDGAVLFSTADEVYFGLNEVGARIWELLPPATRELSELCAVLHRQYPEATLETIRSDVIDLLNELAAHGLVLPSAPQN
jgi:hypothetical protein